MRSIAFIFCLILSACTVRPAPDTLAGGQGPMPPHAGPAVFDSASAPEFQVAGGEFTLNSEESRWLFSENPQVPAGSFGIETLSVPLPRLFPSHYDWPYWVYGAGFANTLRYK